MRFAAAVCLTVATILVGYAHRPLPGFAAATAVVDESGLAFGSFCVAGVVSPRADGRGPVGKMPLRVCDACLLFASPGLGAAAEIVVPTPVGRVLERVVPGDEAVPRQAGVPARARGPPIAV